VSDLIPLPDAPRALRGHGVSISYLQLWRRVVAGDVPARRDGSRWSIDPADLPGIARSLTGA
jgi:hypothetical protein